jgi:ferritin
MQVGKRNNFYQGSFLKNIYLILESILTFKVTGQIITFNKNQKENPMLAKKLQDVLNEQINKEFFSEYQYLQMVAYFEDMELKGFANYFHVQAQEEHYHAMKLFNFVIDLGGQVKLKAIDAPKASFKSIIEVIEASLEHERFISDSINKIVDKAVLENNHAVVSFLKWYIDEQVEEEANITNLLAKVKLINGEGQGLLMIDNELAQRKYSEPVV